MTKAQANIAVMNISFIGFMVDEGKKVVEGERGGEGFWSERVWRLRLRKVGFIEWESLLQR